MNTSFYNPIEYFIYVTHNEVNRDFDADLFVEQVCACCTIPLIALKSSSSKKEIIALRRLITCVLRNQGYTYQWIGEFFGGRDHSTVMSYVKKAENERGFYPIQDRMEIIFNSIGYEPFK